MNRLKNLESPYIQQLAFKYDMDSNNNEMTIQKFKK